jgi:hypothetical protein
MTTIQKVSSKDLETLVSISRDTFRETFAKDNTPENMQQYLDENFNPEKLARELHNEYSEFYFALADDKIIGYLKTNRGPAQTTAQDDSFLEIERIYVLKEYHGKQAGQILFDTALSRARELGMKYIWLGVWEENPRAIAFYSKNGFSAFDKHIFVLGNDRQTDIMMKRPV